MGEKEGADVPVYQEYMNPILEVLRGRADGLPIESLDAKVFELMELPPVILAEPHDPAKPDQSEAEYRTTWARTYLKKAGLIINKGRGVWSVTDEGRLAGAIDAYAVASTVAAKYRPSAGGALGAGEPSLASPDEVQEADDDLASALDEELTAARVGGELGKQILKVRDDLVTEGSGLTPEEADRGR